MATARSGGWNLAYAEVANAAAAGAMYGAQNPAYSSDTAGIALAARNEAQDLTGLTAADLR